MAGIALKGQRDFVSIMVPPEVFLKRKMFEEKTILSQELREMLHFQDYTLYIDKNLNNNNIILMSESCN